MRRKVWLFFISVVGSMGVYFGALVLGVGYGLPLLKNAEVWLKDVYAMKDRLNSEPTELRRVLIFGGSNVLFGFNGAMIEANANVRFINYGTHAGLPINYQVDKSCAQQGVGTLSSTRLSLARFLPQSLMKTIGISKI